MRLSFVTSLAFAGTVFASPIRETPAQEITDVKFVLDGYKTILDNAQKLIEKVTTLKAGDDVVARLKEMSVLSGSTITIAEGMTKNINSTPGKLSVAAATQLAKPSADVATNTVTIINDLVAKKDLFVKAGVHKIVLEDLNHLYKVSEEFVAAARTKIPDQFATVSNKYLQQLLDYLSLGIKNFS